MLSSISFPVRRWLYGCLVAAGILVLTASQFSFRDRNTGVDREDAPVFSPSRVVFAANPLVYGYLPSKSDSLSQADAFLRSNSHLFSGYVGHQFSSWMSEEEMEGSDEEENDVDLHPQILGSKTTRLLYHATFLQNNTSVFHLDPGKRMTIEIKFRNTGRATWRNNGQHFIALNVTNPPGRQSVFQDISWVQKYRPAVMKTPVVRPGEIGVFRFVLKAPDTEEEFLEQFGLVAEHRTWIPGGDIEIAIRVGNPKPQFVAERIHQSHQRLELSPGEKATVAVEFRNVGSQVWKGEEEHFIALNVRHPTGRKSVFMNESWPAFYRPTIMRESAVAPQETTRMELILQAPTTPGKYQESFGLVAENLTWIPGGEVTFSILVREDPKPLTTIVEEPMIRIGLFPTSSNIEVSSDQEYTVEDIDGKEAMRRNAGSVVTLGYENETYSLATSESLIFSVLPLRVVPKAEGAVLEIKNFEHRPSWNQELNDNRFRGILELRYSPTTDRLWIINELSLEAYLRGVAEASNDEDEGYLRALMIAARTYAMYHIENGGKHREESFTIDATFDQAYRGYGFETRAPRITHAVLATEGTVVTYDGEIVVTPYFARSDGRTRSWDEVWRGGPFPWLVSVSDPASAGLELWGHGVGMSAYGARAMAREGKTYEEILKYYYREIELKKIY